MIENDGEVLVCVVCVSMKLIWMKVVWSMVDRCGEKSIDKQKYMNRSYSAMVLISNIPMKTLQTY